MARGVRRVSEDLTEINGRIRIERGMDNHFHVFERVELKHSERVNKDGEEITSDTYRWVLRNSFNEEKDAAAFAAKL